nr:tetratricopeptide repeat protein [Amycolatopsis umgeniensis]
MSGDGPADEFPAPTRCTAVALSELDQQDRRELEKRYLDTRALLDLLLNEFDSHVSRALPDVGSHWVPDPRFTGRRAEIRQLEVLLEPGRTSPVVPVVLHGVTGCGKTSLAVQFAALYSEQLRPVFINATSRVEVARALAALAPDWDPGTWTSGVAEARGAVTPPLPASSATLLIFDGVTEADAIRGLVPRESLCRVLITSTARGLDVGYHDVELTGWSRTESHEYLATTLPDVSERNRDELAAALFDHPLALAQATNHCRLLRRSVPAFLLLLARAPLETLQLGEALGHRTSIIEAIRLNIAAANDEEPDALALLTVLSFLGSSPVSFETIASAGGVGMVVAIAPPVETAKPRKQRWRLRGEKRQTQELINQPEKQIHVTQLARDIAARLADPIVRERAAGVLARFSLVTVHDDGLLVHPLVSLVQRHLADDRRPWLEVGFGLFLEVQDGAMFEPDGVLDPHLEHLAELVIAAADADLRGPVVTWFAERLARRLCQLGDTAVTVVHSWSAIDFASWATEVAEEQVIIQPAYARALAGCRSALAQSLLIAGQIDEAVRILHLNHDLGLRTHPNIWLDAVRSLGDVAADTGRRALAESVLAAITNLPGRAIDSIGTQVYVAHTHAKLLRFLNRTQEADAVVARALELAAADADCPPRVVAMLHEVAGVIARDLGDDTRTLTHELAVLDFYRRQGGNLRTDRRLVWMLLSVADAAVGAEDLDLASDLLQEAEQRARDEFGTDSAMYAGVLATRGRLHYHRGCFLDALADLERAVRVLRAGHGVERSQLPAALVHLAHVTNILGDKQTAVSLAREAYELDLKQFGPEHPETLKDLEAITVIKKTSYLPRGDGKYYAITDET